MHRKSAAQRGAVCHQRRQRRSPGHCAAAGRPGRGSPGRSSRGRWNGPNSEGTAQGPITSTAGPVVDVRLAVNRELRNLRLA